MVMSSNITKCSNSTLRQAWIIVEGIPAPYDHDEIGTARHLLKQTFPNVKLADRIVMLPEGKELFAPFWINEVNVEEKIKYRIGHKYLSVHFVTDSTPSDYKTFSETIWPHFEKIYSTLKNGLPSFINMKIGRLGVGYQNQSVYPIDGFDIRKHFNYEVYHDVGGNFDSVEMMSSDIKYYSNSKKAVGRMKIEISSQPEEQLAVKTTVFGSTAVEEELSFSQIETCKQKIYESKELAKSMFFSFCTDFTKSNMGATLNEVPK